MANQPFTQIHKPKVECVTDVQIAKLLAAEGKPDTPEISLIKGFVFGGCRICHDRFVAQQTNNQGASVH